MGTPGWLAPGQKLPARAFRHTASQLPEHFLRPTASRQNLGNSSAPLIPLSPFRATLAKACWAERARALNLYRQESWHGVYGVLQKHDATLRLILQFCDVLYLRAVARGKPDQHYQQRPVPHARSHSLSRVLLIFCMQVRLILCCCD